VPSKTLLAPRLYRRGVYVAKNGSFKAISGDPFCAKLIRLVDTTFEANDAFTEKVDEAKGTRLFEVQALMLFTYCSIAEDRGSDKVALADHMDTDNNKIDITADKYTE
jgi:hypothetical protein